MCFSRGDRKNKAVQNTISFPRSPASAWLGRESSIVSGPVREILPATTSQFCTSNRCGCAPHRLQFGAAKPRVLNQCGGSHNGQELCPRCLARVCTRNRYGCTQKKQQLGAAQPQMLHQRGGSHSGQEFCPRCPARVCARLWSGRG